MNLPQQKEISENSVLIGQQPILDRSLNTVSYELLFRPDTINAANVIDGDSATATVVYNALLEIGLENLVGQKLAFINCTRNFLINDAVRILPQKSVVLEILEDTVVDRELTEKVIQLKQDGYRIALDDFDYHPSWDPLIEIADIIKFDVMATPLDKIQKQLEHICADNIELLAEKVETMEEYETLKAAGFDTFQGYFFAKPVVVSRDRLPENKLSLLRLTSRLQDPNATIEQIEGLVSQNASLSFKLLRYINSALFALPTTITSIKQAVIYFGMQRLKNWAMLIAMSDVKDKPSELLQLGLTRARLCNAIAMDIDPENQDSYFLVGLFSILDTLLDSRMETIVESLPVPDDVSAALVDRKGKMGEALSCCLACERGDMEMQLESLKHVDVGNKYLDALIWSREAMQDLP